MTAVIRISFTAILATLLTELSAHLYGATTEHLNIRFSDYEIVHPIVVDELGQFLSHDIKNAMSISQNSDIQKRRKRSLNKEPEYQKLNVDLSHRNIIRRSGGAIDVSNDMQYFNESESIEELDMESARQRYSRRIAPRATPYMETNVVHFNVSVFGSKLHLRLESKKRLIAPGAKSVIFTEDGGRVEKDLRPECVFSGKIRHRPGSTVALSNCEGLAGFIQTDVDEFFIEPIEIQTDSGLPQRHVIYRRSATSSTNIGKRMEKLSKTKRNVEPQESSLENSMENFLSQHKIKRSRRHAKRNDYNMEILLIADSEVVSFHGREHVENYLLTLINIVDEIYHDSSLGEHINIVLATIYQLDPVRSTMLIQEENASASLKNVCKWSHDMQRSDPESHGRNYDNSIFLTRRRFGPAGYAHVAGMCETLRSCSLNYEDGFSSAFVVAHETGHVLGMDHDGDGNACGDETSMGSIMAPLVQAAFHRYHWSRCSRQELNSYLVKGKYSCLNDDPHTPNWGPTPLYPGVSYSLDDQCRFDFGQGYKRCTAFREVNFCKTLWCSHDDNPLYCKTKKGPPVDGTECDDNMWCFKGHCVWRDQRHSAISGQWGGWSTYEECSRSCGTGVKYRTRLCNNPIPSHGGSDCIGQNVDYDLCNKRPCPSGHDFRADQCSYRNSEIVYKRQKHKWLPYEHSDQNLKCELYCVSKKTSDIVSMSDIVADGTLCSYENPHGICIRGECVSMGCDKIIGSNAREDDCGVCNGNGRSCVQVEKTITKRVSKKTNNYMKLFVIPKGSRRIIIEEISGSNNSNVFALKSRNDRVYFLNARNRRISAQRTPYKTVRVGTLWNYDSIIDIESISAYGPTNSDTIVMVLVQARGVRFSYRASYVTNGHIHNNVRNRDQYKYAIKRIGNCSATCGNGYKKVKYGCKRKGSSGWSNWRLCSGRHSRTERKKCHVTCTTTTRWKILNWGDCSSSCGLAGIQTRQITCHQTSPNGRTEIVSDAACTELKPKSQQICAAVPCPTKWRKGAWSQCSASCGQGFQRRQVICRPAGRARSSAHVSCLGRKPTDMQTCQTRVCEASANPCTSDRSIFCKMEKLTLHCALPGYKMLCCKSCQNYVPDDSANEVPGQPLMGQSLAVAVASPDFNSTAYNVDANDEEMYNFMYSISQNETSDPELDSEELETPLLHIPEPEPVISGVIDDTRNNPEEDVMEEDDDFTDEEEPDSNDEDYDDEEYDGENYDSINDDDDVFNDDSAPDNEITLNETFSIPNVVTGFKTTMFTRNRTRREVESNYVSEQQEWDPCDLETACGFKRRKATFGCWEKAKNSWTHSSYCSFPDKFVICIKLCHSQFRSSSKNLRKHIRIFPHKQCRAHRLGGKGPRVPTSFCGRNSLKDPKYFILTNYLDHGSNNDLTVNGT